MEIAVSQNEYIQIFSVQIKTKCMHINNVNEYATARVFYDIFFLIAPPNVLVVTSTGPENLTNMKNYSID